MGILSFLDRLRQNKETGGTTYLSDFDDIDSRVQNVYLKRIALDICANFIAKAASQSKIKIDDDQWYYKLNVRPNTDMSATQFWQTFVYRLVVENRVLVILSDLDDLLIADSWNRKEYALYDDIFEVVTVKGFTFSRTFKMSEVLYLEYNDSELTSYTKGLFDDYAELHDRLVEVIKRNNQIRGTVDVESTAGTLDDKKTKELQGYIDKLFNAFKNKSVAIAPLFKGFAYSEHSNTTGTSNLSLDEVNKIQDKLIDTVADILGIPTALLHGNRAELKDNITAFYKFPLGAVLKKIEDELNAKVLDPKSYTKENHIEVIGINRPDMFDLSEAIDKLISSSTFNTNEIRRELGYEDRPGGDEYARTKNLETSNTNTTRGGEE